MTKSQEPIDPYYDFDNQSVEIDVNIFLVLCKSVLKNVLGSQGLRCSFTVFCELRCPSYVDFEDLGWTWLVLCEDWLIWLIGLNVLIGLHVLFCIEDQKRPHKTMKYHLRSTNNPLDRLKSNKTLKYHINDHERRYKINQDHLKSQLGLWRTIEDWSGQKTLCSKEILLNISQKNTAYKVLYYRPLYSLVSLNIDI